MFVLFNCPETLLLFINFFECEMQFIEWTEISDEIIPLFVCRFNYLMSSSSSRQIEKKKENEEVKWASRC